ncbi:MAG: hypothetical protein J7J54_07205 [Candidatus Omnitrophica bacterium]|nr:hypothetical protein [Candidatus Omnitrophota bacterium]
MKKLIVVGIGLMLLSGTAFCITISNDEFGEIVSDSIGDITAAQFSVARPEIKDAVVNPPAPLEAERDQLKDTYANLDIETLAQQGKDVQAIIAQFDQELTEVAIGVLALSVAQKRLSEHPGMDARLAYQGAKDQINRWAQTSEGQAKITEIKNNLVE